MLGKEFLKVDGVSLPTTSSFKYSFDEKETVNTSEAGTDIVSVIRLDKHIFEATWQLTSSWLDQFERFCKKKSVMLTYREKKYECRARGFSPELVEHSESIEGTDGLWKISITFTEI